MDLYNIVGKNPLKEIISLFPISEDFFANMNLGDLDDKLPLPDALERCDESWIEELGTDIDELLDEFVEFLEAFSSPQDKASQIDSITIMGGFDKNGTAENAKITVKRGEILSIVGPTGSGKSRLLADIECMAQGDTPTGRNIKLNGALMNDEERFELEGQLVAQLSQNMNFVMDLSVKEFLEMHAHSRFSSDPEGITERCFICANELAGERFTIDTKVTQLSGGQSRALMIADTAFMSSSPIVLIDEIENAGIDRRKAIGILAGNDKIVFMSTHDPLLALSADKRIVIKNGGIWKIIETSDEERKSLEHIEKLDNSIMNIRNMLRYGELIMPENI